MKKEIEVLRNLGDVIDFKCSCGQEMSVTFDCGTEKCPKCGKFYILRAYVEEVKKEAM